MVWYGTAWHGKKAWIYQWFSNIFGSAVYIHFLTACSHPYSTYIATDNRLVFHVSLRFGRRLPSSLPVTAARRTPTRPPSPGCASAGMLKGNFSFLLRFLLPAAFGLFPQRLPRREWGRGAGPRSGAAALRPPPPPSPAQRSPARQPPSHPPARHSRPGGWASAAFAAPQRRVFTPPGRRVSPPLFPPPPLSSVEHLGEVHWTFPGRAYSTTPIRPSWDISEGWGEHGAIDAHLAIPEQNCFFDL